MPFECRTGGYSTYLSIEYRIGTMQILSGLRDDSDAAPVQFTQLHQCRPSTFCELDRMEWTYFVVGRVRLLSNFLFAKAFIRVTRKFFRQSVHQKSGKGQLRPALQSCSWLCIMKSVVSALGQYRTKKVSLHATYLTEF